MSGVREVLFFRNANGAGGRVMLALIAEGMVSEIRSATIFMVVVYYDIIFAA